MYMQAVDGIFYVIILIMSVVVHEFAHGYTAHLLGDETARLQGRLTLNPLKHLDLFGSIILPLMLILFQAGFVIGWAKPVPYNPHNLRNQKWGTILVAISGILANLGLAIIFGLLVRFAPYVGLPAYNAITPAPFYRIVSSIILINIVLAVFNLIPIPPLDGSKVLFGFLPARFYKVEKFLEQWGIFILLFFILALWTYFSPIIFWLFGIISGMH